MKKLFSACFLCTVLFFAQNIYAQKPFITHVIKKGESLSALASKYHTSVGDIMRLNKMNQKSQLKIGETIKIPSSKTTSAGAPVKKVNETAVIKTPDRKTDTKAVTHVVQKGETLYQISKKYDVPILTLLNLNNLATADIKTGQVLIIKETPPLNPTSEQATTKENDVRVEAATNEVASSPAETTQASLPASDSSNNNSSVDNNSTPKKSFDDPVSSENKSVSKPSGNISPTGYFTSAYGVDVEGRDLQTKTGTAMAFKTSSGWEDKKYYILMNDVPPGSIVKITTGNKTIYAKVLWSLGKMKENEGLDFRISNAAAAALGINDSKFNLTVIYYE